MTCDLVATAVGIVALIQAVDNRRKIILLERRLLNAQTDHEHKCAERARQAVRDGGI